MDAHDALLEELRKHEASPDFVDSMELPRKSLGTLPAYDPIGEGDAIRVGGDIKNNVDMSPEDWEAAQREAKGTKVEALEPTINRRTPFQPKKAEIPEPVAPSTTSPRAVMAQAAMGAKPPVKKPVASMPLGYMPDSGDKELSGALDKAREGKRSAAIGQAGADIAERPTNFLDYAQRMGGGGVSAPPPKTTMWKDAAAEGDRAVEDLLTNRKAGAERSKSAEMSDPNSQTAVTYRTVLSKFSPDMKLEGASAAQMEKIAPWLEKFAAENTDALKAQATVSENQRKAAIHEKERGEDLANREQTHADSMTNAAATRGLAGASLGLRRDEAERSKEDKDQAGAQHLAGKASETNAALKGLDDIDAVIAKNPADIPGIGRAKSMLPDFVKPMVLSNEGQDVRNNARDVLGIVLHKRSGAAVSPAELSRCEQMYGLNGDETQFIDGMKRLRRDFSEELRAEQAGVSPGAKRKFQEGGGTLAPAVKPAVKTMRLPDGEIVEVE